MRCRRRVLHVASIVAVLGACSGGGTGGSSTTADSGSLLPVPAASSGAVEGGAGFSLTTIHGRVYAWGKNTSGEVGDGSTTDRATPVAVRGISETVVAIAAGSSHALAVTTSGAVFAWGHNASGQLGDGTKTDS